MSGRSDTRVLQSLCESGEQAVGLPGDDATHDAFGELSDAAGADFDGGGQGHDRRLTLRSQASSGW